MRSNAPGKPSSERVFINENLTKRNKDLFSLANEERKKFNWKYIWTNNGRILLRQSNDSRVIAIRSEKDIEHIKNPIYGQLYKSQLNFCTSINLKIHQWWNIYSFLLIWWVVYMSFHLLGVLYLIYSSIYTIIMALCKMKTCDMPNCLHLCSLFFMS